MEKIDIEITFERFQKPVGFRALRSFSIFQKKEVVPYSKSGASLGVNDLAKLHETMKKALFDWKTIDRLARNRKRFVYEYNYKSDKKAAERVVKLITQTAESAAG